MEYLDKLRKQVTKKLIELQKEGSLPSMCLTKITLSFSSLKDVEAIKVLNFIKRHNQVDESSYSSLSFLCDFIQTKEICIQVEKSSANKKSDTLEIFIEALPGFKEMRCEYCLKTLLPSNLIQPPTYETSTTICTSCNEKIFGYSQQNKK